MRSRGWGLAAAQGVNDLVDVVQGQVLLPTNGEPLLARVAHTQSRNRIGRMPAQAEGNVLARRHTARQWHGQACTHIILVVDLEHGGVGTGAQALHLQQGEKAVRTALAVAQV